MQIGKVEEEREFAPRIIPITIPERIESPVEDPGISVPNWPAPVQVPVEPKQV